MQQVTLDVEIWVNKTLQTELTSQGMSYHSLTDYDLQLAEVCTVKNSDYCVPAHAMFVYNAGLYWQVVVLFLSWLYYWRPHQC